MGAVDSFLSQFGKETGSGIDVFAPPSVDPLGSFMDTFSGPQMESYWFYDKTIELRFDKESWTYFLVEELGNLTAQYGVTSVIKIIDKSQMLVPWASKMCMEKMLRTIPTQLLMTGVDDPYPFVMVPSMSLVAFTQLALEAKAAHKEKLDDASDVGHAAHACIEASINYAIANSNGIVEHLVELPIDPRALSCANAAFDWMRIHKVRWKHTEKKVYSKKHSYAGTMDGLATYSSCTNKACCPEAFEDMLVLVDWKSSNALRLEYILQVGSYRNAYQEEHDTLIEHGVILRLGKEDGEFESLQLTVEDFRLGFAGFLGCLRLLQAVEDVEDRWKAKKDYRRAAEKEAKAIAKAAAKETEKAAKLLAKEEKKIKTAAEKELVKEQAKANREATKAEAKRLKEENAAIKALGDSGKLNQIVQDNASMGVVPQALPVVVLVPAEVLPRDQSVVELLNTPVVESELQKAARDYPEYVINIPME